MQTLTADELRAGLDSLPQELHDIISALVLENPTRSSRKEFPSQFHVDHKSRAHYEKIDPEIHFCASGTIFVTEWEWSRRPVLGRYIHQVM